MDQKNSNTTARAEVEEQVKEAGQENKPKSAWPLWIRIIAIVLAVLIVGEMVLMNASNVKFSSQQYKDTEYEEVADYLLENDEYMNSSRLDRMRAVVRTLLRPRNYEEYSIFASVAIADGEYNKAIVYLNKCIELFEGDDKDLGDLYVKVGCLWGLQGDWHQAAANLRKGVELNPENSNGWLMLAESYLRNGDYEQALDCMKTYEKMVPLDASQYVAVASMQFTLGRYAEAVESCDRAMELEGCDRASVLYLRAQCYYMMGELDKAQADAESSFQEGGDEVQTRLLGAMCCEGRGDYAGALGLYMGLINGGSKDQELYEQAVSCAYTVDDYDSMVQVSQSALNSLDLDEESRLNFKKWLGIAQLEQGAFEEADRNLSEYLAVDGSMKELFYLRALSRLSCENYTGAIEDFTEAMKQEDLTDECLYNRAVCYIQVEDAEAAAADFQKIFDRNADPEIIQMTCELLGITLEELEEDTTVAAVETGE